MLASSPSTVSNSASLSAVTLNRRANRGLMRTAASSSSSGWLMTSSKRRARTPARTWAGAPAALTRALTHTLVSMTARIRGGLAGAAYRRPLGAVLLPIRADLGFDLLGRQVRRHALPD